MFAGVYAFKFIPWNGFGRDISTSIEKHVVSSVCTSFNFVLSNVFFYILNVKCRTEIVIILEKKIHYNNYVKIIWKLYYFLRYNARHPQLNFSPSFLCGFTLW